jgi:hypothetical protein
LSALYPVEDVRMPYCPAVFSDVESVLSTVSPGVEVAIPAVSPDVEAVLPAVSLGVKSVLCVYPLM